ncbi:hypothetical protein GJ496_005640 [Pomphorhynchus laevis]|nr:hypothetical protein GJ496_005640 [Pomphorhynchus laevis]
MRIRGVLKEYNIVGRKLPSEKDPNPPLYEMVIYATDNVQAKSRFWYFLRSLKKIKKSNGQIVSTKQVFEKKSDVIKNFGIWLRYHSRTGQHNMYKEFREFTRAEAVAQCYREMASLHRARASTIQIMKISRIAVKDCRRPHIKQFHNSKIAFPLAHRVNNKKLHSPRFSGKRPTTLY